MSTATTDNTDIFRQLEEYKWDEDTQFQGGLSAILGNATSREQIQELTLRAQCFYLARKLSVPIDFDAYKAYLSSKSAPQISQPEAALEIPSTATPNELSQEAPPSSGSVDTKENSQPASNITATTEKGTAPYPPTFADIVELITSGKPIPGIKEIPPTLLTDQASKPTASKRRKPWEMDVPEEAVQGAGATLPGNEGEGQKVEGTFGDHRDEVVVQDLPEA